MKHSRLVGLSALTFIIPAYGLFAPACQAQSFASSLVNVNLVTDEADAVLAILANAVQSNTNPGGLGTTVYQRRVCPPRTTRDLDETVSHKRSVHVLRALG
jgi:hypothetical protein